MMREPSFNLLQRFGLASLAIIGVTAIVNGALLSSLLTKRLLEREANVTRDFVQNVLQADGSMGFLADLGNQALAQRFRGSVVHFTAMPDVQRINVYARDGQVVWSTDAPLIGQRFNQNEELDEALTGQLVFEGGRISDTERSKPEHIGLNAESAFFVETYIPLREAGQARVLGVLEIYKAPVALTAAIQDGHRQIWIMAFLGALALYLTLYWIVRSAHRKIRQQHQRLIKVETMAAVGELAASVAHNIRNPLASIRSTAEVAMELGASPTDEQARDIMDSVDRIEGWLRDLVSFAHVDTVTRLPLDVHLLLRECFDGCAREFERGGLQGSVAHAPPPQHVQADRALLGHVLHSLVMNAIQATPPGGRVTGRVVRDGRQIVIQIADTGCGIAPDQMGQLFTLFFTTKPRGLGLGLALARQAIERLGGTIRVESRPGSGTTFSLHLPAT